MPLDPLQKQIAAILKARRSAQSFVGGSSVFNDTFPRRSDDIDIYVEDRPIAAIARDDIAALEAAGLKVEANDQFYGFVIEARVSSDCEVTNLEWNEADRRRFYPIQPNETFGWTLHKTDLAVQKLVAASTRRVARDAIDVLLLDQLYAPLAALAIAAPAKLEGSTPVAILERARLIAIGHPMEDYETLRLDAQAMPFAVREIKTRLADRIQTAIDELANNCLEAVPGLLYLDAPSGNPAIPLDRRIRGLTEHPASERGTLPIFSTSGPALK